MTSLLQAVNLLQRARNLGIDPNTIMYNTAISALGKSFRWEAAEKLFQMIPCPDTISYETMIAAYGLAGQIEKSEDFFTAMLEAGHVPRDYAFCGLIAAYRSVSPPPPNCFTHLVPLSTFYRCVYTPQNPSVDYLLSWSPLSSLYRCIDPPHHIHTPLPSSSRYADYCHIHGQARNQTPTHRLLSDTARRAEIVAFLPCHPASHLHVVLLFFTRSLPGLRRSCQPLRCTPGKPLCTSAARAVGGQPNDDKCLR